MNAVFEFVASLKLQDKLSPRKNVEIIWFYIFFPCFVAYLYMLSNHINSKPAIGTFDIFDKKAFEYLIRKESKIELIAEGLKWTEGPLWMNDESASSSYLMFSDTILNKIFKWEEGKGLFTVGKTIYVEYSGCKSNRTYCDSIYEPGSNGIIRRDSATLDLIVCQHGERSISLLRENGTRSFIATHYKGKRLNSPNDLVWSPDGHLYFTDPIYGLYSKSNKLVGKELKQKGIYMVPNEFVKLSILGGIPTTAVKLLDSSVELPNGLAFSPDYSKLYVSNSNKRNPYWKVFDITDDGSLTNGKLFYNASSLIHEECESEKLGKGNSENKTDKCNYSKIGAPDGLKVDINGNLFASGPGGVLIISPEGNLIGRLRLNKPVSNVAFGEDGRLYITASDIIARVSVKTKPARIIKSTRK
eukprot:gene11105-14905_t